MDRTGAALSKAGIESIPMRLTLLFFCFFALLYAEVYPVDITPEQPHKTYRDQTFGSVRILDQKEIILESIDGIRFAEASDLAYDSKKQRLYMVGDKGILYIFKALFSDKIETLSPLHAYRLTKEKGRHFRKKVDSEGLTLDEQGNLLISFERKPKIGTFATQGERITRHKLPHPLSNRKHYRGTNKMLESVALHPQYGILTASEFPLKRHKLHYQTLYALSGKQWHFLAEPERKSAVTAIEVMDDGNLLVLERAYTKLTEPRTITLKKLYLDHPNQGLYPSKVLLKMPSDKGWHNDNFEGLTKIAPHRYLMVSDDNNNFFQRTLLIYFEVVE